MCCRYGYEPGIIEDISFLTDEVSGPAKDFTAKDICPSDPAVILKKGKDPASVAAGVMPWGFIGFDKKLLINARAESALEKRTFSESVRHRRCIIPARHFYEWDRKKVKNTFTLPMDQVILMAGFYSVFDGRDRFIILTTAANGSMSPVHDRMPLILGKDQARSWIREDSEFEDLLFEKPPELIRKPEYEQLSLF